MWPFEEHDTWQAGEFPFKQETTHTKLTILNEMSTNRHTEFSSTWSMKSSGFVLSCFHQGQTISDEHVHKIGIANHNI